MRYFIAVLATLLVAAPAAAVAGPDALSIAKRALRLAKEPPEVTYVYDDGGQPWSPGLLRYVATCPRGMLPIGEFHEFDGHFTYKGRSVIGIRPGPFPVTGGGNPGLTAVCIEARLAD